jgi:putative phosphoribosyl transferase
MQFASRQDGGRKLAGHLEQEGAQADLVLGLPRGGVVVAAEVARALHRPLDVLVVRKIGHPHFREFAVGALAEPDVVLLHKQAMEQTRVHASELDAVIAEERQRLRDYRRRFAGSQPPDLAGKSVLLADDGLATGSTMQAAVQSARQRGASRVLVAVPVASEHAFEVLSQEADRVYALLVDPDFEAVGRYYALFEQTTDEEVMEALQESRCHFQPH